MINYCKSKYNAFEHALWRPVSCLHTSTDSSCTSYIARNFRHNKSYPDVYPRDGSLLFEMRYFNAGGEGKSVFITDIRRAAILLADTQYVKAEICRRVPNLCKEWNQLNSAPGYVMINN